MIENILIVDTETTGLFPDKGDKLIEIGLILFNLKHKAILQSFSSLFPCDENPVEKINHISVDLTKQKYNLFAIAVLESMLEYTDALVAHNADFDKRFVETLDFNNFLKELIASKKWICTKQNFTWPVQLKRFRLEDICVAMKVPYINAHRALADCLLLVQCFQKVDDLEARFNRG